MSKTRFQMTVRVSEEVRDALDRRVEACRAIGTPVERASLAAALLGRAVSSEVDVDALRVAVGRLEAFAEIVATKGQVSAKGCAELSKELGSIATKMRTALKEDDHG